jgi:hypothetical protein
VFDTDFSTPKIFRTDVTATLARGGYIIPLKISRMISFANFILKKITSLIFRLADESLSILLSTENNHHYLVNLCRKVVGVIMTRLSPEWDEGGTAATATLAVRGDRHFFLGFDHGERTFST